MSATIRDDDASEKPSWRDRGLGLARVLPIFGWLCIAVWVLAWRNVLPGGYLLHNLVSSPAERAAQEFAQHATQRLDRFADENAELQERVFDAKQPAAPAIVFLGSSTIERFPLERCFPNKPCLNRGIASASTPTLVRFLETCLPEVPIDGVVLYAGAIDWRELNSVDEARREQPVEQRVAALVESLQRMRPAAAIVLLGLLPERGVAAEEVTRLRRMNSRLAMLARAHGLSFVETARHPLTNPAGSLAEEFSADAFHLDERGYEILSRWIVNDGGKLGRKLAP